MSAPDLSLPAAADLGVPAGAMPRWAPDLGRALREQAPPREVARILLGAEPPRDPVPFRAISAPVEARAGAADWLGGRYAGRPLLWGTHSATNTQDMHGTWWSPRALASMRATAARGLVIWLNHDYSVPESILGQSVEAQLTERTDPDAGTAHTDLDIATLVVPDDVNPRAMQSYRAVQHGVRLGQSVGCYILDWEWQDPDGARLAAVEEDMCGPVPYDGDAAEARLMILDVLMVESSLVGLPSNRRSWVHEASRALRRAGVLPPVRMERLARQRSHYLGASVGEVTRDMVEQGQRAAAAFLAGRDYAALPEAERERMARGVIAAVKEKTPLMPIAAPLPEALLRDQSARITRIADAGCETRAITERSADAPTNTAAGPDAARCDCGCACTADHADPDCDCDCADCALARTGDAGRAATEQPWDAEAAGESAPAAGTPSGTGPLGNPAAAAAASGGDLPAARDHGADAVPTAGRSLTELDAALNAAAGVTTGVLLDAAGQPVAGVAIDGFDAVAPRDADAKGRRKAEKRAAKQARLDAAAAAITAEHGSALPPLKTPLVDALPKAPAPGAVHHWSAGGAASPPTGTPTINERPNAAHDELAAIRAEVAAQQALRDDLLRANGDLLKRAKRLRRDVKAAKRVLAQADNQGLYRPLAEGLAPADAELDPHALTTMSDDAILAYLRGRLTA